MDSELPIKVAAWLIWSTLVVAAAVSIWWYFGSKRTAIGFWQFTMKQFLFLVAVWSLLVWMLYLWVVDRFFTPVG